MPEIKKNYQKRMEHILSQVEGKPALLLQACCAPCSTWALEALERYFDITLYYYNPNTHPALEYEKRLGELKRLADIKKVRLKEGKYDTEVFFSAAKGMEELREGGARCEACFKLRLLETARAAKEMGVEWFATTLTVSPHKNAELINAIGRDAEERYGVRYLPTDLKKKGGYQRSIELSREYGLYRQAYCGCKYSLEVK